MRTFSTFCLIAAVALSVLSCGDRKEEEEAREIEKQAAEQKADAPEMVKGMQEMASRWLARAWKPCPVELVSFVSCILYCRTLTLGEGKPTREDERTIAISQAEVIYTKGDAESQ